MRRLSKCFSVSIIFVYSRFCAIHYYWSEDKVMIRPEPKLLWKYELWHREYEWEKYDLLTGSCDVRIKPNWEMWHDSPMAIYICYKITFLSFVVFFRAAGDRVRFVFRIQSIQISRLILFHTNRRSFVQLGYFLFGFNFRQFVGQSLGAVLNVWHY